jgi:hypothetical protein
MSRPSGLPIIPDDEASVITDTAAIDGRGRVNLVPRWRSRVGWLAEARADTEALMIFAAPGHISIRDYEGRGTAIIERYRQVASGSDPDKVEALRLIQDRYQRLIIPSHERASLGTAALLHLGLLTEATEKSMVHVSVSEDAIDLLSPACRAARLLAGHALLEGLP